MTGKKITELSLVSSYFLTDIIPIVRPNEVNLDDRNKKILIKDLLTYKAIVVNPMCNEDCSLGSKCFEFYSTYIELPLIIQTGFDFQIATGNDSIQIHRWNQTPNSNMEGREWVASIPNTGGTVNVNITPEYRYISFSSRNPNIDNMYDTPCVMNSNNTFVLIGY